MATVVYKVHFLSLLLVLSFIEISYCQRYPLVNTRDLKEDDPFWQKLTHDFPNQPFNDAEDEYTFDYGYELDNEDDVYKDFIERSLDYSIRPFTHKKCKVIKKVITLSSDNYEFSPNHYVNLTCEETNDNPFNISPPHTTEYCFKFHHPHLTENCKTKYRTVPIFRRNQGEHYWEQTTETLAVGCGCSVGIIYV